MRSNHKHIVACCVLITSAVFATPLLAECLSEACFSPPHPQLGDPVTFDITFRDSTPILSNVLIKTTVAADSISFDVILTSPDNIGIFPDYQSTPVSVEEFDFGFGQFYFFGDIAGSLGPLAAGGYFVTTAIHSWDPVNGFGVPCTCEDTTTLTVYADGLSPVIEYYNANLDHYFITQNLDEITALDAGTFAGWVRTGQSFLAYLPAVGGGLPVARYYGLPSAGLDTHFYTFDSSPDVAAVEANPAWVLETADAFNLDAPDSVLTGVCPAGDIPVYRLWNGRSDSDHRYTTDPAIKAQMIAKGYVAEGYGPDAVMMCAPTR